MRGKSVEKVNKHGCTHIPLIKSSPWSVSRGSSTTVSEAGASERDFTFWPVIILLNFTMYVKSEVNPYSGLKVRKEMPLFIPPSLEEHTS